MLLGLVTAVSALRVRGVALAVVTIAAAVAVFNFGFINPTWGGGATGSPVPDPHLFGINLGPTRRSAASTGTCPSPVFGWVALTAAVVLGLLVVVGAPRHPGTAHARGPVERASRGRGCDRRP